MIREIAQGTVESTTKSGFLYVINRSGFILLFPLHRGHPKAVLLWLLPSGCLQRERIGRKFLETWWVV